MQYRTVIEETQLPHPLIWHFSLTESSSSSCFQTCKSSLIHVTVCTWWFYSIPDITFWHMRELSKIYNVLFFKELNGALLMQAEPSPRVMTQHSLLDSDSHNWLLSTTDTITSLSARINCIISPLRSHSWCLMTNRPIWNCVHLR